MDEVRRLLDGGVGVVPTDTLYGIVASAFNAGAVERVYRIKDRMPVKPPIILVASIDDLARFDVTITPMELTILHHHWPGPVSVIFPCENAAFAYLHRGANSLAFRLPNDERLRAFLAKSGPLIAPSANPEGLPPAKTVAEAKGYFGDLVDFYIDDGTKEGSPSVIIRPNTDGTWDTLRK